MTSTTDANIGWLGRVEFSSGAIDQAASADGESGSAPTEYLDAAVRASLAPSAGGAAAWALRALRI